MNYFIVFQKTYEEECLGEYLWAPKKNKIGNSEFHWENMTKIKDGDRIFSIHNKKIVSVNIANGTAIDSIRPIELDGGLWDKEGWNLKAKYNKLENPILVKNYKDEILKKAPRQYSPFNKNGTGNQGYLFEAGRELGEYLMNIIKIDNSQIINAILGAEEYLNEMDRILNEIKDETEKDRFVKIRIGQGKFREKLLQRSCKCEICNLDIKNLLIASHCKPWRGSTSIERLDENNGLLLCPNHDALFDKGLISFRDDGTILISDIIEKKNYDLLNINNGIKIKILGGQADYIKYHREYEFKESKNDIEVKGIDSIKGSLINAKIHN